MLCTGCNRHANSALGLGARLPPLPASRAVSRSLASSCRRGFKASLRHAPAAIFRAPLLSTGCHWHAQLALELGDRLPPLPAASRAASRSHAPKSAALSSSSAATRLPMPNGEPPLPTIRSAAASVGYSRARSRA
eukprot:scaffold31660_cov72-Isochrysis_galbana.AAC.1